MRVYELKTGAEFRCNKTWYRLLKPCGPGSAYVQQLNSAKDNVVDDGFGETTTFKGADRKFTIAPTAEVDEVRTT